MSFFSELEKFLSILVPVLPAVAAANTASNPAASNEGVSNVAAAVKLVMPLVQAGDALSTPANPLTGAQKFQNVMDAAAAMAPAAAEAGFISQPVGAYTAIIAAAINTAVAIKNAQTPAAPAA